MSLNIPQRFIATRHQLIQAPSAFARLVRHQVQVQLGYQPTNYFSLDSRPKRHIMTGTNTTTVQEIPTLADLYEKREIPEPAEKWKPERQYRYAEDLNKRISIWRGDITKLRADMIVNAANSSLLGGGGVDGAIHRAAGSDLLKECETLGGAETGETKVTKGYKLPARWVAHTVGPIYNSSKAEQSAKLLESCYHTSLSLCAERGGGSIGFSSISTGVYGYPIKDATAIALETTRNFLEKNKSITRVIYVVFSARDEDVYKNLVGHYFPASNSASNTGTSSGSGASAGAGPAGNDAPPPPYTE